MYGNILKGISLFVHSLRRSEPDLSVGKTTIYLYKSPHEMFEAAVKEQMESFGWIEDFDGSWYFVLPYGGGHWLTFDLVSYLRRE